MRQKFSYGWRTSHRYIEPILSKRYSFELAFQCPRFEVNQSLIAEVMSILVKSGQSASREETVEETKERLSVTQP